jgi:uncharacterized caspase-like protein
VKYKPAYDESWALVIGINKYRHAGPLEIARADAEAVRTALIEHLQFPSANVTVLLDEKATRVRIMAKFLSYDRLGLDDRLFVFFAGTGALFPQAVAQSVIWCRLTVAWMTKAR